MALLGMSMPAFARNHNCHINDVLPEKSLVTGLKESAWMRNVFASILLSQKVLIQKLRKLNAPLLTFFLKVLKQNVSLRRSE